MSPYQQTVAICAPADTGIDRTVDVGGRALATYRDWVRQSRGPWQVWRYHDDALAGLFAAVPVTERPTAHADG